MKRPASLMKKAAAVLLAVQFLALPSYAGDPGLGEPVREKLTYSDALEMARLASKGYKQAKFDVERAQKVRDLVSDDVRQSIGYESTSPSYDPDVVKVFTGLMSADLRLQMSKKNIQVQEDSISVEAFQRYTDVVNAADKVEAAAKELEAAEWKIRSTRASSMAGMVSGFELTKTEADLAAVRAKLETSTQALNDAYSKLDTLLGQDPSDRPILVDEPEFAPMEETDLDYLVRSAIANSPSVYQAQYNVDIAKQNQNAAAFSPQQSWKTAQIDIEKAQLAVGQAKEGLDKQVRRMYYSVRQQEEQYQGLKEALRKAEEIYRVAKVQFEVGVITKADLIAQEAAVVRARQTLFDLVCQHEIMKRQLEKPWVLSGSSGG